MSSPHGRAGRAGAPLAAAAVTAAVLVGALWIQRARGGWPFSTGEPASPSIAATESSANGRSAAHSRVSVDVPPAMVEELDVRTEVVRRESLTQTVRAVAVVVPDESRISHVHTRVAGWIEELYVNTTGERVRVGQPLARVFSQELFSSQAEYLAARRNTEAAGIASAVVSSGRTRLGVLGMTPEEIEQIERTGEPMRLVNIVAPRSGVVVNRGVSAGTAIDPSTTLLTIADLSTVWVIAEVPEASIPAVRVGASAELDFPASGRSPFAAPVDFAYPTLTERTRTLRVRFSVRNADGLLRPGLYGTASFVSSTAPTITVPRDAVVDTGLEQHVFVADGQRFEPRPVTLGVQLADRVEVRSGLEEGERIVAAGVFLLDSESRLRATGGAGVHAHAGAATPRDTPAAPAGDPHEGHRE